MKTNLGTGTTTDLSITLDIAISELYNVIAELYTDAGRPVKFSYLPIAGYGELTEGSSEFELKCKLLSASTMKMKGCLLGRIMIIADEAEATENAGRSIEYDTTIVFS